MSSSFYLFSGVLGIILLIVLIVWQVYKIWFIFYVHRTLDLLDRRVIQLTLSLSKLCETAGMSKSCTPYLCPSCKCLLKQNHDTGEYYCSHCDWHSTIPPANDAK